MEITPPPLSSTASDQLADLPIQQAGRLAQTISRRLQQLTVSGEELRKAAQEFEGYFLAYLLKVMRDTVPKGFIENKAGAQFYSFYDQEIGRLAAQAGGIGLATIMENHLKERGYPGA